MEIRDQQIIVVPSIYDVEGEGYVSFNLKGVKIAKDNGSCGAPDAFDLVYYGTRTDANGNPLTGDYFEQEVENALSASAHEGAEEIMDRIITD